MKKLLLLLAVFTLTLASCSKDDKEEVIAPPSDLSVSGPWLTAFDSGLQYGLEFGNGQGTEVSGYYALNFTDTCLIYDGYWNIVGNSPTTITLAGENNNRVVLTYRSASQLGLSGNVNGVVLSGIIDSSGFNICN